MRNHSKLFLAALLLITGLNLSASPVLTRDILGYTENIVVLPDGRVFVAGDKGIFEIKRSLDLDPACHYDLVTGLTLCRQVNTDYQGRPCFFSGMTTDGTHLYAACTVWNPWILVRPIAAALYKVTPGFRTATEILTLPFPDPIWYNGMTMLDDNTLLMSASSSGSALRLSGPAIARLTITDQSNLSFEMDDWLARGPGMLMPNGLVYKDNTVFFIGGQTLFSIPLNLDGSAGEPELLYRTPWYRALDDLTWTGSGLALAEIAAINGLGKNYIVLLDENHANPKRIDSGKIQLSSLALDRGTLFEAGVLLGTSFFQGGFHLFVLNQ